MKRMIRIFSLVLAVAMRLTMNAFAANATTLADIAKPEADFDIPENLYMD